MKDRIVQHPNRYKLTPVAGTSDTFDLAPVPGVVTAEGTPLNKANLLSDTTTEMLGLSGDKTVDEAFARVALRPVDELATSSSSDFNLLYSFTLPSIVSRSNAYTIAVDLSDCGSEIYVVTNVTLKSDHVDLFLHCVFPDGYERSNRLHYLPVTIALFNVSGGIAMASTVTDSAAVRFIEGKRLQNMTAIGLVHTGTDMNAGSTFQLYGRRLT